MKFNSKNIVVFSSCPESWGGSEELWSQSVEILARKGYKLHIFKTNVDLSHPQMARLKDLGAKILDINDLFPRYAWKLVNKLLPFSTARLAFFYRKRTLPKKIRKIKPDLLIISQGANYDGLEYAEHFPLDEFPSVIISQKAVKCWFPLDASRDFIKRLWRQSKKNYFVSEDNLKITQDQFGMKFDNAEVVRNPFLTKVEKPLEWKFSDKDKVKIACVGRLFVFDKGQDILLNVLAKDKWRKRNVEISFFGKGVNEEGLKDMAKRLGLENVQFKGHVSDILLIWKEHQALILPARNEGLPLVVVETMMCGRVPIVTDVGGNSEVIENDVTGFIAESVDERCIDEVLERAWKKRGEWEQIGKLAAENIRGFVSENPAEVFADKLETIINQESEI